MFFDLQNYWAFILLCAAIYVAISTYLQGALGGKNSLKSLQAEMRQLQMKMGEAGKRHDNAEMDRLMGENMQITMKLMSVQLQFAVAILLVFFTMAMIFAVVEPGQEDDVKFALFDDGLAVHCDSLAGDGIHSNCFVLSGDARRGAWVVDGFLKSPSNETLSRGSAVIYYEGGKPEDVWPQSFTQGGLLDVVQGKKQYHLKVTTDKQEYSAGQTVKVSAMVVSPVFDVEFTSSPSQNLLNMKNGLFDKGIKLENPGEMEPFLSDRNQTDIMLPAAGGKTYLVAKDAQSGRLKVSEARLSVPNAQLTASADSGTFFYIDLPFQLPLINIRRIIGSTGVLIFLAFLLSISYSLLKAIYDSLSKKKN